MKISKLFHWLYAILMFLPIMVFIPNAFYYGFNEHAASEENGQITNVYYESNSVTSINDLVENRVYTFTYNGQSISNDISLQVKELYYISGTFYDLSNNEITREYPFFFISSSTNRITTYYGINPFLDNYYIRYRLSNGVLDFVYINGESDNLELLIPFLSECPRQYVKEKVITYETLSITDSMSYAWKSTWQNDLFSWTYGSFLTQPFLYITDLFNVPSTNTLVYCLSYWLDISIIWLVFDLIMYIPLLVHRWIDKGIIE